MAKIDPKLRARVLEQFTNDRKSKQKKDSIKESTGTTARPGATLDDSLLGQMLEHQQGNATVDVEALKVKRQRIKEVLNKPLLKSLLGSM